jgi:hypothetical protein
MVRETPAVSQMIVPSKKTLVAVAVAAFVVFAVALWRYLVGPGSIFALAVWAGALLTCFESVILMRQAKRPFHLGVFTFALIYAALVIFLHWIWSGL